MKYYHPKLLELAYDRAVGRRSEDRARSVYFGLGEALQSRDLTDAERAEAVVTRRAIEDRHPGIRVDEYRHATSSERFDGKKWRPKPLPFITVVFQDVGGTVEVPIPRSRSMRVMSFVDREHLLDILAGMALSGHIDPETTLIRRGSSAIPYIQFAGQKG